MANMFNINTKLELSAVGVGLRKAAEVVKASDFTDGGGASGTYTLNRQLPAGAFVLGVKAHVKEAFDDDSETAALEVGIDGNADAFADGIDISTSGVKGESGYDQTALYRAEATDILLTVTGNADFTSIAAGDGEMMVEVIYLSTVAELVDDVPGKYYV